MVTSTANGRPRLSPSKCNSLLNPSSCRPNAQSAGSSQRCRTLFCQPRHRPAISAPVKYRYTIFPRQLYFRDPDRSAASAGLARRRPCARSRNIRTPAAGKRNIRADRATATGTSNPEGAMKYPLPLRWGAAGGGLARRKDRANQFPWFIRQYVWLHHADLLVDSRRIGIRTSIFRQDLIRPSLEVLIQLPKSLTLILPTLPSQAISRSPPSSILSV